MAITTNASVSSRNENRPRDTIGIIVTLHAGLEAGVAAIALSSELKNNEDWKKNKSDENFKSSDGESHP